MRSSLICAALALGLSGCIFGGDPIEGSWEADDAGPSGKKNEFTVDECDGDECTGDGDLFLDDGTKCDVEIKTSKKRDLEYEIEVEAKSPCTGEFEMDCEMNDDEDELDCEGNGKFNRLED